jgi:hypothetical protein
MSSRGISIARSSSSSRRWALFVALSAATNEHMRIESFSRNQKRFDRVTSRLYGQLVSGPISPEDLVIQKISFSQIP